MELKVFNLKKEAKGTENVSDSIFGSENRPYLLHDYVLMQRRAYRQGTANTKTRAEVSGSGKKPFRQKGTGNARQGTLIGPHQVGGGIAFGPRPRDYTTSMNKKARKAALKMALSQKVFEKKLGVLDSFDVASGKTKEAFKALKNFSEKSVLVIGDVNKMTERSVRNIPNFKVLSVSGLNVLDILNHDFCLVLKSALPDITKKLEAKKTEKKARAA